MTVIAALIVRGAWNLVRRRNRSAFSAWMMAFVWGVFWWEFCGIATNHPITQRITPPPSLARAVAPGDAVP